MHSYVPQLFSFPDWLDTVMSEPSGYVKRFSRFQHLASSIASGCFRAMLIRLRRHRIRSTRTIR